MPTFSNDIMYSGHCAKACAISYPGKNAWKISYSCCEVVRVCPGSQPWWIIEHVTKSLDYTLFDARWIPCSARFVVLGNFARGTGALQIYEVSKGELKLLKNVSVEICIL